MRSVPSAPAQPGAALSGPSGWPAQPPAARSAPPGTVPAAHHAPAPAAARPRIPLRPATPSAGPRPRPSTPGNPDEPGSGPGDTRTCSQTTHTTPDRRRAPRPGGPRIPLPHPAAPRGHAGTGPSACRTSAAPRTPAASAHASLQSAPARPPAPSSARQAHQDPATPPQPDIIPHHHKPTPRPQQPLRLDPVTRFLPAPLCRAASAHTLCVMMGLYYCYLSRNLITPGFPVPMYR